MDAEKHRVLLPGKQFGPLLLVPDLFGADALRFWRIRQLLRAARHEAGNAENAAEIPQAQGDRQIDAAFRGAVCRHGAAVQPAVTGIDDQGGRAGLHRRGRDGTPGTV